jgi:predicted RNA-binding Zn-ribbon protein involved in translation (DUF1610 family)
MEKLLERVRPLYPALSFIEGDAFSWSPSSKTITYALGGTQKTWSLLHELAHANLGHISYKTDFELLLLEVAAWEKAKELAKAYSIKIDEERIQDCIDTYRDWLYQRSSCPSCDSTSLQHNAVTYQCFNCGTSWTVTASRFCRPYRLTKQQKTPPGSSPKSLQTTFMEEV